MKQIAIWIVALGFCSTSHGAGEPAPLRNIKLDVAVSYGKGGIFKYAYSAKNPKENTSNISAVEIFLPYLSEKEAPVNAADLQHCRHYNKHSSDEILKKTSVVPVGSTAPKGWSCGYGKLAGSPSGSYGWSADDEPDLVQPGSSINGLVLTSRGLPAIRDIMVDTYYDVDELPSEYFENVEKTVELNEKIRWRGKTVGPKAPPKVFNAVDFLNYLASINEEAFSLGWIKNRGLLKSLAAKLDTAKSKIEKRDIKAAKNILDALQNEIGAQKGKQISTEAYALFYFNVGYLQDQLKGENSRCDRQGQKGHEKCDGKHDHDRHRPDKGNHDKGDHKE